MFLPDAINNVVLAQGGDLRQPAKILRWIQDIEGRMIARWGFGPGRAGVGVGRRRGQPLGPMGPDPGPWARILG